MTEKQPATRAQIAAIVFNAVADYFLEGMPLSEAATFVDDLGIDSLDAVDIMLTIEERFEIGIEDEVAEKLTTIGQGIDYLFARGVTL